MDKSRLKWNGQCGVLRHNPYVIQINFGANLRRTRFVPRSAQVRKINNSTKDSLFLTAYKACVFDGDGRPNIPITYAESFLEESENQYPKFGYVLGVFFCELDYYLIFWRMNTMQRNCNEDNSCLCWRVLFRTKKIKNKNKKLLIAYS